MYSIIKKLAILAITLLLLPTSVVALDVATHKVINEKAGNIRTPTGFTLNNYLIDNLDFSKGVEEIILDSSSGKNQKISFWLRDGGLYEDKPPWSVPYLRSLNHYHNPIKDHGYFNGTWMSSTQWALLLSENQSPGGYYSWYDVRDYYLKALTLADPNERNTNFAKTFRGIGQLMHLVHDASVPAHTRDDAHISLFGLLFPNYETWVGKRPEVVTAGVANPIFFDGDISTIASFIDTNQYDGADPYITLSDTVGLSEYANANFASEGTIFTENFDPAHRWYFPYPKRSSTEEYSVPIDISRPTYRVYFRKVRDGETIEHFAAAGRLYKYLEGYPEIQRNFISLDGNCYRDYAEKLIPRAVGYSAGLINYFFRGQMDMEKVSEDPVQYAIKNLSGESMSGRFSLYYDDMEDNRIFIANWGGISINAGGQTQVTFDEPTSPEPKERGKYILVFEGALGNEDGAIVGSVVKPPPCEERTITISGPDTPIEGSCYAAEEGIPEYTWQTSCGSIDGNGCVSGISGCQGTVTITAIDSCGNEAAKDVNMPEEGQTLQISGPDALIGSGPSTYTVTGGTAPYTWSISCGAMRGDVNGTWVSVYASNCCGTGTITVTDANGKTGSKTLRMPGGVWAEIASCQGAGSIHPTCGGGGDYTVMEGQYKWEISYSGACGYSGQQDCCEVLGAPGGCNDWDCSAGSCCPWFGICSSVSGPGKKYEWRCQ